MMVSGFNVTLADGCSASGTVTYQSVTSKAEKGTTIVLTTKTQSAGDNTGGNGGGNEEPTSGHPPHPRAKKAAPLGHRKRPEVLIF